MTIRLMIAEPDVIALAGIRKFLCDTDIEIVAEVLDGHRAVELALERAPDVVLLAIWLPSLSGLRVLERIKSSQPDLPVLITACVDHAAHIAQAHKLGAAGFLPKAFTREELLASIRKAEGGNPIWSRDDLRRVTGVLAGTSLDSRVDVPLTPRECQVLEQVTRGLTNRQIAQELKISYETVKEHVQHIIHKIGVSDRTQAAVWAVRNDVV